MQDVGTGKTAERPIRLGGALVTVVEPHPGQEVAYNRWYERDHFYAGCMIGAWTIAGARFVCTRDLKDLRYPNPSPVLGDASGASFMSVYWVLAGRFGEWIKWGTDQVRWLIDEGDRMFTDRDHVHTLMYRFRTQYEHPDGVPVELALDHRSPYAVLVVGRPAQGVDLDAVDAWFRARDLPGVVGAEFTPVPMGAGPSDVPADDATDRFTQLWFVDDDLPATWSDTFAPLGPDFAAAGLGELLAVSPFRATIPGTDTYTDQLR